MGFINKAVGWVGNKIGGALGGILPTSEPGHTGYKAPTDVGYTPYSTPGGPQSYSGPQSYGAQQFNAPWSTFRADPHYNGFRPTTQTENYNAQDLHENFGNENPYNVGYEVYDPAAMQQQQSYADSLRGTINGTGPESQAHVLLGQALQANQAQNASNVASERGINAGLGTRQALNASANQAQQAAGQGAALQAQETEAAQAQLGQVTAQMAAEQMQRQLANQQTAFKNADMYQAAMNLNESKAAHDLQAAMQAQQLNEQVAYHNQLGGMQAQQLEANVNQQNTDAANAAIALNAQTSMGNAQLQGQTNQLNVQSQLGTEQLNSANINATNQINSQSYLGWLGNATQNNAINAGLQAGATGAETQRMGINAGVATNNANNAGSFWGNLMNSAGGAGAAMLSDERVKEDIEPTGDEKAGVPEYTFRYKPSVDPSGQEYRGFMAQDVEQLYPWLVNNNGGGLKTVQPAFGPTPVDDDDDEVKGYAMGGLVGPNASGVDYWRSLSANSVPTSSSSGMQKMFESIFSKGGVSNPHLGSAAGPQSMGMSPVGPTSSFMSPSIPAFGAGGQVGIDGSPVRPEQQGMQAPAPTPSPQGGPPQAQAALPAGPQAAYAGAGAPPGAQQGPYGVDPMQAQQNPYGAYSLPQQAAPGLAQAFQARAQAAAPPQGAPQQPMVPQAPQAGGPPPQAPAYGYRGERPPQAQGTPQHGQPQQPQQPQPQHPALAGAQAAAQAFASLPPIMQVGAPQAPQAHALTIMPAYLQEIGQRFGYGQPNVEGQTPGAPVAPGMGLGSQQPQQQQPMGASSGAVVPGQAPHPGVDAPSNDVVDAKLTPGEIVLPLSVTQHPDAPNAAAAFVAHLKARGAPMGYESVLHARRMK